MRMVGKVKFQFGLIGLAPLLAFDFAHAHEVSASDVKVVIENEAVEVWQTTPYLTAYAAAEKLSDGGHQVDLENDEDVLAIIGTGWSVTSDVGNCEIVRQAHRRIHHDTQLQFRYLFSCSTGAVPSLISMPWFTKTQANHFVLFELETDRGPRTKIIEHGNETVSLKAR